MIQLHKNNKLVTMKIGNSDEFKLTFNTDNIDDVIKTMQEKCSEANSLIFNSITLWKVIES